MNPAATLGCTLLACALAAPVLADDNWRVLDPDNTLVIESSKGRMIIEMRPDMAPKAVERIRLLAREKVYDGLQFHRVIARFVAQTGNPNNRDGGASTHPNLPPEMMFKHRLHSDEVIASAGPDAASGLLGSVPFQSGPLSDAANNNSGMLRAWGAHCPGVAGMGRNEARESANSELYFMLAASRRLDRDYTVFGRIVVGTDVLQGIAIGEPPAIPDVMTSVRVLADMPAAQRPKVSVMAGPALSSLIARTRLDRGADFSICDVVVPARVE
jgi:peptidylprolyl isomerase